MPTFERLELWSDYQAAGGTPICDIPDLLTCRAAFNVEAPDQESLSFAIPVTSRNKALVTARKVARTVFTDGSFNEWKISKDAAAPLSDAGRCTLTAQPPIFALVECGLYYTTGAGGARSFTFSLTDVTPSAAMTALVLGTPDCPSWIGLGTITPSVLISVEGEFQTPLAIWFAIRDAIRAAGIGCEARLRRNGTTQYLLDLVTAVGASAPTPEVRVAKQLIDYVHEHDTARQATRIIPRGPVDATGVDATLARARFKVTAVNGGTLRLTVADDAGGGGPIAFDDQYLGWYVFRERTGRTFQIVHTYAATQEIELATVSNFAAHSVTAPEWVSLRLTEALNGTRRWGTDAWAIATPYNARWSEVTAVGAGTLTLTDNWGVGDPIIVNNRFVDWRLRRSSLVLATTFTMNVTAGRLDCASVTGVQAGDLVVIGTAAAAPYGSGGLGSAPGTTMALVTSVDTVNKYLYCTIRYAGTWITGPFTYYARIFREVATQHLVTASVAATNVVTVDAVGTAANTDLVEIIQPCQGTLPYYVESPADVASYGKKIAVLGRSETGEVNLAPNACQRVWTNASNPPDGYVYDITSGAPSESKETTITRQGGASWLVELAGTTGVATAKLPPARVHPVEGASYASVRLKAQFPASALSTQEHCHFAVKKVDVAGTVLATPAAWGSNWTVTVGGPNNTIQPEKNLVAVDTWIDIAFEGLDVTGFVDELLRVDITGSNVGGGVVLKVFIDGVQITQTVTAPRAEPALLIEFAEATKLLQVANLELLAWAAPPVVFSMTAADLEAIDPTLYSEDKITLGGTIRAVDPDATVDVSLRLMQWSPDYHDPAGATYVLATLPALLSDRLAGGGSTSSTGAGAIRASAVAVGGGAVAWDAIAGKPATFPATAHVHTWADILSAVAGQGPRVGVARMDSSGDADIDVISGSPGATQTIFTSSGDHRHFLVVTGQYNNTDAFMDLVCLFEASGLTVGEISKHNVKGTSKPRTYSTGAGTLLLSLGGGGPNTYKVRVVSLNAAGPA